MYSAPEFESVFDYDCLRSVEIYQFNNNGAVLPVLLLSDCVHNCGMCEKADCF